MRLAVWCVLVLAFGWMPGQLHAKVAVFLEEPYGYDGAFGGVGHAAVYLDRVCAASPASLRRWRVRCGGQPLEAIESPLARDQRPTSKGELAELPPASGAPVAVKPIAK